MAYPVEKSAADGPESWLWEIKMVRQASQIVGPSSQRAQAILRLSNFDFPSSPEEMHCEYAVGNEKSKLEPCNFLRAAEPPVLPLEKPT
ncbi:hypothetical protein ACVITL_006497 [Rhizobium pisi]